MMRQPADDPVSRVIGLCHRNRFAAEYIWDLLVTSHHHRLEADGAVCQLSDDDIAEFATRFSSEVEPEFYHSARRKEADQEPH